MLRTTVFWCLAVDSFVYAQSWYPSIPFPQNVTVQDLGAAFDPDFPNVYRDGGGGVMLDGCHLMVFADTSTTDGLPNGTLQYFTDNSFATFGQRNSSNPTLLTDYGSDGHPNQAIGNLANETDDADGNRWVIWPNSNMAIVTSDEQTAVGVWTAGNVDGPTWTGDGPSYNTMVQVTMGDSGPNATRLVDSLFQDGEILYGSFSLYSDSTYLYLFGSSPDGIKVARSRLNNISQRSSYKYWNGNRWTLKMPAANDTSANMFTWSEETFANTVYPDSGDVFYDNYHKTFVCVFTDSFVDGLFRMTYATGPYLTSAWSNVTTIYSPPAPSTEWNYAGHAYPSWDPTGETLLLSYSAGGAYTNFAKVIW